MLKPYTLIAFCFLFLLSTQAIETNNDIQKKILRSGEYDIECYVSLKEVSSYDEDKAYYWFKSGEIHSSRYGAGGFVLHKTYSKFYESNQLAEKGEFNYGLKDGVWKSWYKNGQLKEIVKWNRIRKRKL
jgi:antitoxin component YwqK of YwqJK toxin-antitoxin module